MNEIDLSHFAAAIAELALIFGVLGGMVWHAVMSVAGMFGEYLERRADKQSRIRNARWRARWNRHLREARESGLRGRRVIGRALHAMKADKQAASDLLDA